MPHSAPGRRRPISRHSFGSVLLVALLATGAVAVVPADAGADRSDRVDKLVERGESAYQRSDFKRATKYFAKADRKADGRSLPAVMGLARSSLALARYEEALEATKRWIQLADRAGTRAGGYQQLGFVHYRRGLSERWSPAHQRHRRNAQGIPEPGDASLRAARDAFRRALDELGEDHPERHHLLLNLAETLTWLDEDDEVSDVLDAYAAAGGSDPHAAEVRCWTRFSDRRRPEEAEDREDDGPQEVSAGEVQKPVRVHFPAPEYPPGARAARMEGVVMLESIINQEGTVDCIRPLRGYPYPLAQAAMAAVRGWRFEPARRDGEPVSVFFNVTVNFTLE